MKGLSLVAGYGAGAKPRAFEALIDHLQHRLAERLGDAFAPYALEQVHGTIIGLEAIRRDDQLVNANYLHQRGEHRPMDLAQVLAVLDANALPLRIRIGGYLASEAYPFTSQGKHPHERSFSVRGKIAVAMGWPAPEQGASAPVLDGLRRRFAAANVLHKYHAAPEDVDDDFYFVLGRVDRSTVGEASLTETEVYMREDLAARGPSSVVFDRGHVSIVAYQDLLLPLETSRAFSLDEAMQRLAEIRALY